MDIIENSLSEDVRRTIILFYFDEMSTKEIAEAMGIPQGTVLWRLGFARKKIKKEVEKYEKETNTKLYSVALPFLALLFRKEAEQVVIPPMSASLAELSASKGAALSGAGKTIASEAIRKGTGIVMKKILIGLVTLLAVGAAVAGIVLMTNRDDDSGTGKKKGGKNKTVAEKNQDGYLSAPYCPRDSQESSPTPQFKSINSSALSFHYSPNLTFIHDYWKNHSFD